MLSCVLAACGDEARPPSSAASPTPATTPAADDAGTADAGADAPAEAGASTPPVPVAVAAGATHSCALVKYGSSESAVYCWGDNALGQLGNPGTGIVKSSLPAGAGPMLALASHGGGNTTCTVDAQSSVWCWGANDRGQAGAIASASAPPSRVSVGGVPLNTNLLAVGARHGCVTRDASDGSSIACWGDNSKCQLGLTDDLGACVPDIMSEPSVGNELGTARNPSMIAPGLDFTCSLSGEDAKVRCWGANDQGQCAQAPAERLITPVEVGTADAVVAGSMFACSVMSNVGRCWGSNQSHAVSDDAAQTIDAPFDSFPGVSIATIAAGSTSVCAVDTNGKVHCRGTLPGNPATALAVVDGVEAVSAATVGAGHVCVIGRRPGAAASSFPEVLCWGSNTSGQSDPARAGSAPVITPTVIALPARP